MRLIIMLSYTLLVVAMAAATIVEQYRGAEGASRLVYGSWWFVALWGCMAVSGAIYLFRRVRKPAVLLLHIAFMVILAGAAITHFTGRMGYIHLRQGEAATTYQRTDRGGECPEQLPFTVALRQFTISRHPSGGAPADYHSHLTIYDQGEASHVTVSMNNIYAHRGVRLCQANYDRDMRGTVLAVCIDPVGIAVTYTGYAMLFVSFVVLLAMKRHASPPRSRTAPTAAMLALSLAISHDARAATTIDRHTADELGRLCIMHNGRVCPLQTYAIDFTRQLCGQSSYKGHTAEQVLAGFMLWPDEWADKPILRVKGGTLRAQLQWPRSVSLHMLFRRDMGGYVLRPYVELYHSGQRSDFLSDAARLDEAVRLAISVRGGAELALFPQAVGDATEWFAYQPYDKPSASLRGATTARMGHMMARLRQAAEAEDTSRLRQAIAAIAQYQCDNASGTMPTDAQMQAERIINVLPLATILAYTCMAAGIIAMTWAGAREYRRSRRGSDAKHTETSASRSTATTLALSCHGIAVAALSALIVLRWVAGGRMPLTNGYETMLFLAWVVMAMALADAIGHCRKSQEWRWSAGAGLTMSGICLLVARIGQMSPAIAGVAPVLSSPLLSVHVSLIMLAFGLLSLMCVCGVAGMALHVCKAPTDSLATMGQRLLLPALSALSAGIFIGAVWGGMSWGRYWGWDAKETWALITLMVYAVGLHRESIPALRRPMAWHIFATAAFATIAMTYLGVNYLLSSRLHTYA